MKKILVIISTFTAIAVGIFFFLAEPHKIDSADCAEVGEIAAEIMSIRQNGGTISGILNLPGFEGSPWREVVFTAFKMPLYSTEQHQTEEVARFRAAIEMICYENWSR
ncbi:hypothetical protein [Roseovarius mucosus]|uniref:hypothetical protein n=1 Tax=Roseovarius mucosus TaxID=215743 RepID=UPI003F71AC44